MTKIDYNKHNKWIMNTPRMKAGHKPLIITKNFADELIKLGEWEKYKSSVIIDKKIK